ncbi:MAG: Stp1/IreP family PP2C-type Ser/Thr phosphatase [Selenomonadaceae bacterium]|nr:Stp1/IreP family PP2C-type Ser/Thr phosphatase [Selenomonadaceae bacterium]
MRVFQSTDAGSVRSTNEDALFVSKDTLLVADGMGGHAAGEVASSLLTETVKRYLNDKDFIDELVLKDAILLANEAILHKANEKPEYYGMGTTATLAYTNNNILYYAHVGDSRLYVFRNGELNQITEDHSYVANLVKEGVITEEEALHHPKKNYILRAVGIEKKLEVDTGKFALSKGDKLLLTTDGITNVLDKENIIKILSNDDIDPADMMIKLALKMIARDNITAVVAIYDE